MVKLHFGICIVFFAIGFAMRYGMANSIVEYFKEKVPVPAFQEFDDRKLRMFIGETAIKMGCFPFLIAMTILVRPDSLLIAVTVGWLCLIIFAISSVTVMDKYDVFKRFKKVRFYGTEAFDQDPEENPVQEEEGGQPDV